MENKINRINKNEDTNCIQQLCTDNPDIVLKTEYGTGHYKFVDLKDLKGGLVLEFKLMEDSQYKDTQNINNNIGEMCLLTIGQYLYVYNNLAIA